MAVYTFRIYWIDNTDRVQYRYFYSLKQAKSYVRVQCAMFSERIVYQVFNGSVWQSFVVIGNQICTASFLRSELDKLL